MKFLYRASTDISSHITLLVVVTTAVALFVPASFSWIETSVITPLLGIVMFGMGLTLKPSDFVLVLQRPKDIIVGELSQFIIMPIIAWALCRVLSLPQELALGVILVGCCPGGTASNVMCYLAKGDIALSVGMTAVSTVLAPLMTPLLVLLPMISTLAVGAIIGIVVSHNAANILGCSLIVGVAVILHNLLGLVLGYAMAKATGLNENKCTAISIEVGMQNSGLATSLAATHFAMYPMATVPGAIFSVWHNFSGSIAAGLFAKLNNKTDTQ